MFRAKLTPLIFLTWGITMAQEDVPLLYRNDQNHYILIQLYPAHVFDQNGKLLCTYLRNSDTGNYEKLEGTAGYPDTFPISLATNFVTASKRLASAEKSDFTFDVSVTDSIETEMMPCGQAEVAELCMKYTYTNILSLGDKILAQNTFTDWSFSYYFNKAGILLDFVNGSFIWVDDLSKKWCVYASDGFTVVSM